MKEIVSAHITHKWVDIRELELYSAKEARSVVSAIMALDSVRECALLKTCNRLEIYVATDDPDKAKAGIGGMLMSSVEGADPNHIQFLYSVDSVRHLARVASGLESMIVGEEQILSQVKSAYDFGLEEGSVGKTLGEVFRKSISIGKKVRSETGVSKGSVSIGSAAVELANGLLESLQNRTILVIGAGEVSQLVAMSLARHNVKAMFVANRTYDDAVKLAERLGGEAVHFDKMNECLLVSDVVICGTAAPHIILSKDDLVRAFGPEGPTKTLLIIDISNPRNIAEDVAELPNVEIRDMDGLKQVADRNAERRRKEVAMAERIIEKELKFIVSRFEERRDSEDAIRQLHTRVAEIRDTEFTKAMNKLNGIGEQQKKVVRDMLMSVTKKILAEPTAVLREASKNGDKDMISAAETLFKLQGD